MSAPDFWDDQNAARALMAEVNPLKHRMEAFSALKSRLEDIDAAIELAQEADDDDLGREAVEEFARWQKSLADFELLTLLNGPQDQASCYVTIHAGPAARKPVTGHPCYCACISAGVSAGDFP